MTIDISLRSINDGDVNKDLPTNVNSKEQLSLLPSKYLSDDTTRPLLLTTNGVAYKYALRPLFYSALAVLLIEFFERMAYYTIVTTQTEFLSGGYSSAYENPNSDWSANLSPAQATTFSMWTTSIAYIAPFIGGIVADGLLGDYFGIIAGISIFYLPGLLVIALVTFPGLLGSTFNMTALRVGMLGLMPIGTGFIKSLVNVFGAKQYHPILQTTQISSYYTNFYVVINIGALIASAAAPGFANINIEITYFIPFISMCCGFIVFLSFSKRFVMRPPEKEALYSTLATIGKRVVSCRKFEDSKHENGVKRLLMVFPVTLLIVPFGMVYSQMTTVFVVQGQAMKASGFVDASSMNTFDTISCILSGIVLGSFIYPALAKKGIHFPVTYKFAIGSVFATLAIVSGIIIDKAIKENYNNGGKQISVWFLGISYFLVGMGEVLTNSAGYEAAFKIAPSNQKGLAMAINLFMMGSLPSLICIGIKSGVNGWFPVSPPENVTYTHMEITKAYVESDIVNYFWILFGIVLVFGVFLNLLPPVKNFVESIVSNALDLDMTANLELSSEGDDDSYNKDDDKAIETFEEGGSSTGINEENENIEEIKSYNY